MPAVTILLGSNVDQEFAAKIVKVLQEFAVDSEVVVASAHKVPEKVVEIVSKLNRQSEPTVVVTCVGMSNGLAGGGAGSCVHPVLNCPPFKDLSEYQVNIHSSLQLPSEVPVMTVLQPTNAALAAVRILAESDPGLRKKLMARIDGMKAKY